MKLWGGRFTKRWRGSFLLIQYEQGENMLYSQKGSIYRVILGCFIVLAFCFALI